MLTIDPEKFGERDAFLERVETFVAAIKSCPPAPGVSEVLLPGERAARERLRRKEAGIVVDDPTWKLLGIICDELGIAFQL